MPADPRPVLVLLATAGRPDLLGRTLASVGACARPAGYAGTIVVENGPPHGAAAIVAEHAAALDARYLHVPEPNKSNALNVALRDVPDDTLVVFLDDDVRLAPAVLTAYAAAAAAHPTGRFFGGPTDVDYERPPAEWLKAYLPPSAKGWAWDGPTHDVDRHVFLGFNWAAVAGDLRAAGGFDPARGPGAKSGSTGQEADMQRRLLAGGVRGLYVPEARVWHYVPVRRCTPEWVIERGRRKGVERGIEATKAGVRGARRVAMLARYAVRRAGHGVVAAVARCPQRKFKAQYWRNLEDGVIRGLRLPAGGVA